MAKGQTLDQKKAALQNRLKALEIQESIKKQREDLKKLRAKK